MWNRRRRTVAALLAVGAAAVCAAALDTASLWAQSASRSTDANDVPLTSDDVPAIENALRSEAVLEVGHQRTDRAFRGATRAATCAVREAGVDPARRALRSNDTERALSYARGFLEAVERNRCSGDGGDDSESDGSVEDQKRRAFLLSGNSLLELDRPEESLEPLTAVDASETPIPDYVHWLRARARAESDQHSKAADLYGRVFDYDHTPLEYRARTRQAHALVEAERSREALPVIRSLLELFPEYPRRFRLLYDRARALEHLGRDAEAAEAYQTAWYEYPHKPTGDRALVRLRALEARGIEPSPLTPRELFDRYRDLRINKHWSLAERLFEKLRKRITSDGSRPALEHKIEMQLALNAFVPKRNREALRHLRSLREDWKAGRRAGIRIELIDKYLSRTLARLGRFEEALAAQRRRLSSRRRSTRNRELIEFFSDHSRYEKAFDLADAHYSDSRKERWPYLWLLYKTERFEDAEEGFQAYAEARSGRRSAKAQYWRARVFGRMDRPKRAKEIYTEVADRHGSSYYGIQAVNRLVDLKHRGSVDQLFSGQTGTVIESGEKVFATFERANSSVESTRTRSVNPKTVPRRAERGSTPIGSSGDMAPADCFGGTDQQRAFCRLLAGDIPRETVDLLGRALIPYRSGPSTEVGDNGERLRSTPLSESNSDAGDPPPEPADIGWTEQTHRVEYSTPARIHWSGRGKSEADFRRWERGEVTGPIPDPPRAYDEDSHLGGVERAASTGGDLFPALDRTHWLFDIGLFSEARTAVREAALEFRGITKRYRPPDGRPHELPYRRWSYHIDHRRYGDGYWGYEGDEVKRYPVPDSRAGKRKLADRQQEIWNRRESVRPELVDAMKQVGDYHLVRKFTQDEGGWYNRSPTGPAREMWMQAYPRAFPRHVARQSRKHGINPYLIWALMTVESAYNPDSISTAEAIGLLQVIPRTGIKVASWVGDDDFGPYDLVDERVAIRQGVHYFSSLVRKFRGQELLAMAGYNGGPHRVATWLERKSPMPADEFVEEVPFDQARLYVKKVTRLLNLYLRIYEGQKSLYVGQELNRDPLPDPNF